MTLVEDCTLRLDDPVDDLLPELADLTVLADPDGPLQRCRRNGGPLDHRTYPDRDHLTVLADDSPLVPDLVQWTRDRLDRRPAPSSCRAG